MAPLRSGGGGVNSIEITAAFGSCLLAMAFSTYLHHRQCVTIDKQAKALDAYKHALDGEKRDHMETCAKLASMKRMHREECL